ncbi:hypothetical protein EVG20_g2093 [Dentipellis fragilis]|uniref:2,5-diamino-6-ribosylamino-4(3H)-pyrimidinone 5'-phosphate reductase n=1 Tax=Dentipellis fragilis TaxID=205917 RepID=A0A4Y9ZBY6_9AGAM|nr:hypothetical protein EVG20_g2093 [Dentipellis fragilis]
MSDSNPPTFLSTVLGTLEALAEPGTEPLPGLVSPDPLRPYVTLTFAQSLDAKIAGTGGRQLILTAYGRHRVEGRMRTMHDGILIGVNTAVNDNPQLNVRHLPFPTQNTHFQHYHHPRPLILDAQLRLSPTCKLLTNAAIGAGKAPWVISSAPPPADGFFAAEGAAEAVQEWEERKAALEEAGARIVLVERETLHPELPPTTTDLPVHAVLKALKDEGIRSVMVEGGARIIQSFLSASGTSGLVDTLIVTVAPMIVGRDGVGYGEGLEKVPGLLHLKTEVMGKDVVMGMKVVKV